MDSQVSPAAKSGDMTVGDEEFLAVMWYVATDCFCIWILVNTLCIFLLLMAKAIQFVVFGDLRINEKQNLMDKCWNFLFYKFIFLFGVLDLQTEEELVMWCLWFSALLFLQLLAQLCKDRYEYLSFSSTATLSSHAYVLFVLMCLLVSCGGLSVVCGQLGTFHGAHTLSFMAVECLMVTIYVSHVIIRSTIHLYDLSCEGFWEDKEISVYYTDFIMEIAILCLDLMHHVHMLLYGNIWFSVAGLIIFMQLRFLYQEMQRKLCQHKNHLRICNIIHSRFSVATIEDLATHDDRCAICWDRMLTACKLPCGHLFHISCLRSWLDQDMSCPTCRMSFNISASNGNVRNEQEGASLSNPNRAPVNQHNHFLHFDGSHIASWLPGFSVELVQSPNMTILLQAEPSQENTMVHQAEEFQQLSE